MAIEQSREARPGSEQGLGVDVGAQAGTGALSGTGGETGMSGRGQMDMAQPQDVTKILKPLPHAVIDYAWAGTMMAAPWLFGFSRNKEGQGKRHRLRRSHTRTEPFDQIPARRG